jgi:hypothetical protein
MTLRLIFLGLAVVVSGCGAPRTQAEIEYYRAEQLEKWAICEEVYRRSDTHTIHFHKHHTSTDTPYEINEDLTVNNCRMILRSLGLWQ